MGNIEFQHMNILQSIKSIITKGNGRTALIKKNILASFFIKGISALVQFLLVPLTLSCLGVYENGVWLTISSVLLWIDNLDIGLGNGLRNKLAVYMARKDTEKAREMVSSTFAMLAMIITPVALLLISAELLADNYSIFNVDRATVGNLDTVLIVTTLMVCATFIFKFIGNFYMGLQLPAINNLLVACGNTTVLLGTLCAHLCGCHSLLVIALINTMSPLMVYLIAYPITFSRKYHLLRPSWQYVKASAFKELFVIGINFFVLQISAVLLFYSTNIIISHLFSPSMVTPYQIVYRYFMIALLLFTVFCVPYWTATTDAYVRKDFAWMEQSNRVLNIIIAIVFLIIVSMILLSDFIYSIWIQDKAHVPFAITVLGGLYQFILIWSTRYSIILNGIGALRLQTICTICAAISFVPLAIIVGKTTKNINHLLLVMCAVNTPGLIINAIQYNKLLSGKASGIWIK